MKGRKEGDMKEGSRASFPLLLSLPLLLSFPRKRESIFAWQGGGLASHQTDGGPDGFPFSRE